jgi:hypothetical protein
MTAETKQNNNKTDGIRGVSGGIVNILGDDSMDYSK